MNEIENELLKSVVLSTPTPSQVSFANLVTAMNKTDRNLDECIDIIKSSPTLAFAVLHLANSAYYRTGRPCESVQEAVQKVGTVQVMKLVVVCSSNEWYSEPLFAYSNTSAEFLRISLLTATLMDAIALKTGEEHFTAYTIGLIHSICKKNISECLQKYYPDIQKAPKINYIDLAKWEESTLGMNHADIAGIVMPQWGFPENLSIPIEYQFRPLDLEPTHPARSLAALLHIAMVVATSIVLPNENESAASGDWQEILNAAHTSDDMILDLLPRVKEEWEALCSLM